MSLVLNEYTGDGVTTTFNFAMVGGYLSRNFVVFLTRPNDKLLEYSPYTGTVTWLSDFSVRVSDPIPVGTTFVITRRTDAAALVDFQNTSRITERNLDTAFGQSLHRTVELEDVTARRAEASTLLAEEAVEAAKDAAEAAATAASLVGAANAAAVASAASAYEASSYAEAATDTADAALALVQQAVKGNVDSFNGRDGAVLPQQGDYTPDMVGFDTAGVLSPVADFSPVPAWSDPMLNAQAQALANRSEFLRDNQKRTPLHFATYAEASAAAATLPDGQTVEILSEGGQRTRRKVASGVLGAAVSAAAVSILPSMAALRSAPANPGAIYRIEGSGEYRLDITDSTTPDNARDVLVDTRGGRWKLVTAGVWGASGSQFTQSVEHRFYADKSGAVRIGGSDPAPLDDQRNYWRGLPSGQSTNSWRDAIGLASFSLGRNGASPAYLSGTFGHDCVSYGVAGIAGGAGSATGDPDNPSAYSGYCSFAYGKNVIAFGEKSTALGEETRSGSRGSLAAGIFSETGPNKSTWPGGASDGIGAVAVGHRAKAFGDGAAALGHNVTTYGGALAIGKGISDAKPMEVPGGGLGLGYKVTKPTLQFTEGSSETQGVMLERGSRVTYVNNGANEVAGSQEYTDIENSGGGGWARRGWSILRDGVLTPLFEMSAGGNDTVPSFKTRHANGRLGSNAMPWEYLFVKYAPVVTSDRRKKTGIASLPDSWLDAVRLVEFKSFKPLNSDRSTIGVIAQDVIEAFQSVGASAFEAGIVIGTDAEGYAVDYTALQCLEMAASRRASGRQGRMS